MYNRGPRNGALALSGAGFLFVFVYLILALWIGGSLVNYILLSWLGSTVPGIVAVLIALFTGFNFLLPAVIITWILDALGVLHHVAVLALPHIG